jgi:RNA polymerase sigma-70 factor (ECF subfamily)
MRPDLKCRVRIIQTNLVVNRYATNRKIVTGTTESASSRIAQLLTHARHAVSQLDPTLELSLPASLPGEDAASIRAVQEDVLRAFDDHAAGLRRYLTSFGLGPEATDDVLQEVFLSLARHLQLGRGRSHLKGWLFRVGHNLALKQRQQRQRRQQIEQAWDGTAAARAIDPAADPEQQLAEGQRLDTLRAVLHALPERDRHCLSLRAEGLGYREIAKTLGISLGSVAKSLGRGFMRLTRADRG